MLFWYSRKRFFSWKVRDFLSFFLYYFIEKWIIDVLGEGKKWSEWCWKPLTIWVQEGRRSLSQHSWRGYGIVGAIIVPRNSAVRWSLMQHCTPCSALPWRHATAGRFLPASALARRTWALWSLLLEETPSWRWAAGCVSLNPQWRSCSRSPSISDAGMAVAHWAHTEVPRGRGTAYLFSSAHLYSSVQICTHLYYSSTHV